MARYQVIRGVVHHPGGIAAPGEIIALDPAEGDPLCVGREAVLARVADTDPAAPATPPDPPAAAPRRRPGVGRRRPAAGSPRGAG